MKTLRSIVITSGVVMSLFIASCGNHTDASSTSTVDSMVNTTNPVASPSPAADTVSRPTTDTTANTPQ